ncbi:sugar phosphate isomerase/epimerase family protein [Ahrensia kielensis]|uniref:Sugar phosphate isomerase/epimerase family protein n=1 Tax=Ahrensia kielensis TaxID=76980 RepID=A0ABU9T3V7_9HYPH
MKIGLGTYCFRWSIGHKDRVPEKPMSAMDVLDFGISEGCAVVQYADNLPLDKLSIEEIDALAEKARQHNVVLEIGTQSFDAEQVRVYLDIAKRINAPILRIALDGEDAATSIEDLAAAFRPLLATAREIGCKIAIENHFNYPSQRMVTLLEAVNDDCLGVCLDVANSICAKEWPEETIKLLAPFTINLHLKDYDIIPDFYGAGFTISGRPLGQGRTDIGFVFDALKDQPSDMSLIVEHWLPYEGSPKEVYDREIEWTRENLRVARNSIS